MSSCCSPCRECFWIPTHKWAYSGIHLDCVVHCRLTNSYNSFTGQVRLHSVLIRTSTSDSAPSTIKVFSNKDDIDFETASSLDPTQTLTIAQSNEIQEYPVKRALFSTTRSLTLFVEDNWGQGEEDVTRLSYLAFKGDFMKLNKEAVSFLYEAAANPNDHKLAQGIGQGMGRHV